MGKFNLEDYETVQSRLPKFFAKYPAGRVITELKSPVDLLDTVVFQASLYDGEVLLSTGWAFEKAGEGFVNKTSHLENCETSAIGRALANITIHGDKRPSREEMEKVQRMEKEQPKKKNYSNQDISEKNKISPDQIIELDTIIGDKGYTFKQLAATINKAEKTLYWEVSDITVDKYENVKNGLIKLKAKEKPLKV